MSAQARRSAPVVTIDGPSGSGKGTVSRLLAQRVGWHLLDSGALYRLVALAGELAGLGAERRRWLMRASRRIDAGRVRGDAAGNERVLLDGRDVTAPLRTEGSRRRGLARGGLAGAARRHCWSASAPSRSPRD